MLLAHSQCARVCRTYFWKVWLSGCWWWFCKWYVCSLQQQNNHGRQKFRAATDCSSPPMAIIVTSTIAAHNPRPPLPTSICEIQQHQDVEKQPTSATTIPPLPRLLFGKDAIARIAVPMSMMITIVDWESGVLPRNSEFE